MNSGVEHPDFTFEHNMVLCISKYSFGYVTQTNRAQLSGSARRAGMGWGGRHPAQQLLQRGLHGAEVGMKAVCVTAVGASGGTLR